MAALNATNCTIFFTLYAFLSYSKKVCIYPETVIKLRVSREMSVCNTFLCTWRTKKKVNCVYVVKEFLSSYGIVRLVSIPPGSDSCH